MIAIKSISPYLSGELIKIADLPERSALSEQDLAVYDALGIETVFDTGLSSADLAIKAGQGLLNEDRFSLRTLVVIQGRVPEMFMASESARIQNELGLTDATSFSVGDLGCVSVNAALLSASALLESNRADQVLLVHGSKPPAPKRRYRRPVTINGDGGIACVLSAGDGLKIIDSHLETNGEYWDLYRVVFQDRPTADWVEEPKSLKTYSFQLAIESRNRFQKIATDLLQRNGMSMGDVNHFVMQNLSLGAFRFYEEFFKIKFAAACYENLRMYGHLGSMDILLNLHSATETKEFKRGERVLVLNNSPVAAWAGMLIEV